VPELWHVAVPLCLIARVHQTPQRSWSYLVEYSRLKPIGAWIKLMQSSITMSQYTTCTYI
jgi:hypothetical protein